ncbi:MAG: adenylate kinase [Actinobacteria bacterium]|nr:adenylate kinase [Actinomycetota bacterium]
MNRVVVFGRGGSGKSTLCRRLGEITGLPVIELDKIYWDENLVVLTPEEWTRRQSSVVRENIWILDGDLGPYDVTAPRLARADTVIIMDTPLARCVWRALRRGRQRIDFWAWVMNWGRKYRPQILDDVRKYAPTAEVVLLSNARDIDNWLRR